MSEDIDLSDDIDLFSSDIHTKPDDLIDSNTSIDHKHKFSILEFILNCFIHVSILFLFLYILFGLIIEPIAVNGFKHEFSNIIHDLINKILPNNIDLDTMSDTDLDTILSKYPEYNNLDIIIKFTIITNIRKLYNYVKSNPYIIHNYLKQYSKKNYFVNLHNNNVFTYGQCIVAFAYVITVLLCILFKYYYPNDINLTKLFTENFLTFVCIGIGEYWFFMTYAVKFIPAQPSLISKTAIDIIKSRLSQ